MSLILAIEPDARQASQLRTVIRRDVGAELIFSATTERPLAPIGTRVPDLVLIPALLAPQDDAALAAALRVIASAAHVQMLTIPLLASSTSKNGSRGAFSIFRRDKTRGASPDGCDPSVFAAQITSYLENVIEERRAATECEEPLATTEEPSPEEPSASELADLSAFEEPFEQPIVEPYAPLEAVVAAEDPTPEPFVVVDESLILDSLVTAEDVAPADEDSAVEAAPPVDAVAAEPIAAVDASPFIETFESSIVTDPMDDALWLPLAAGVFWPLLSSGVS